MNVKKLCVMVLCGVMLISAAVMGTIAYLTDSSEVVNTFTVGEVDIKLDEAIVDENGEPVGDRDGDGLDDRSEEGNQYHLIPGKEYTKDPTMSVVKGSEESYVRMLVKLNCYKELQEIFDNAFLPQYFVDGWDAEKWISTQEIEVDEENNTAVYEFRYFEPVKAEKDADTVLEPLFTTLKVPAEMSGDDLKKIKDLEISVEAHAIQKYGFENETEAWKAFSK